MRDYRFYPLDGAGKISGVGEIFSCADDNAAIEKGRELFPSQPFEVWDRGRLVHAEVVRAYG